MKEFMFLVRGYDNPTEEQMQQRMQKYMGWMQGMMDKGLYKGGQPLLQDEGRMVNNPSEVLTDGPFMEAKEIIGGYVIVNAKDYDEAVEYAKTCPLLDHCKLEVRELKAMA